MTADWSQIPDPLLHRKDTRPLRAWLDNRGLTMSLLELENERRRRGFTPPSRRTMKGQAHG